MFGLSRSTFLKKAGVLVALGSALGARAGTLYTVDVTTNELQTFNTQTLAFTNVAPMGVPFDFGNLAYNGSTMYMSQGYKGTDLYTLNLTTGNGTLVGNTGLGDLFGLAFDGSGNLWGGQSSGGTGFYSVNSGTGAVTEIGNPGFYLDALTYLPTTGQLLGIDAGPGTLYSINTGTGAGTLISNTGIFINNCGMAYDPDTGLLWVVDWSGQVLTFNPNNNFAETVVLTGQDHHDGLASVAAPSPEPATIAGIGIGVMALLRRRRK